MGDSWSRCDLQATVPRSLNQMNRMATLNLCDRANVGVKTNNRCWNVQSLELQSTWIFNQKKPGRAEENEQIVDLYV